MSSFENGWALTLIVFVPVVGWGNQYHDVSLESVAMAGKHVLPGFRGA